MNTFFKTATWMMVAIFFSCSVRAEGDGGRAAYQRGLEAYITDPTNAVSLFLTAVSQGSVEAMMAAAHCCEEGHGTAENYEYAVKWRLFAVQKDPVRAAVGMARIDSLWQGIREKDRVKRRVRFERHAADADEAFAYVCQLLNDGKQTEAEDMLERAIVKFPPEARMLFARGVMSRSRWSKLSARVYFKAVAAVAPESYYAQAAKAAVAMDEKPPINEVSSSLKDLVKKHPDDIFLRWMLAVYCRACEKHDPDSLRSYEWILERWNPGPVMVHQSYANELSERLGRHEEALAHREIAIRQAERSWTCQGLANTLFRLHRYAEAEPYYARAAELDAEDSKHFYQWGRCLVRLERFAEAEKQLRHALDMDPNENYYRCQLGFSLLGGGKYEEALNAFKWVDEHRKWDGDEMWGLAQIYSEGLGVERDDLKADAYMARLYASRVAVAGPELIPRPKRRWEITGSVALEDVGEHYYYGKLGMPVSYAESARMFFKAAKENRPIGACGLVQIYAEGGHHARRDVAAALEWFDWLEEKAPKDYLRSPAIAEVVWIRMGRYGERFRVPGEAVRIATAVYEANPVSANGVLLARALASDGRRPDAEALMHELVERAEANGHIRGLEEKKHLLALYESGGVEEIEPAPPIVEDPEAPAVLRPADLNKPPPVAVKPKPRKTVPAKSVPAMQRPREYPPDEEGALDKAKDYRMGLHGLKRDYAKALECYTRAYELNGKRKNEAARGIAHLYRSGGPGLEQDIEAAEQWLLRLVKAGDRRALSGCLWLYFSYSDRIILNKDKALEYAEIIRTSDRSDGVAHRCSALLYALLGRFDDAVKLQERAIVLMEQDTELNFSERGRKIFHDELECYRRGEVPPPENRSKVRRAEAGGEK